MPDKDFIEEVITALRDGETMTYERVVPTHGNLSDDSTGEVVTVEFEPEDVVQMLAREAVVSKAALVNEVGTVVDE